MSSTAPPKPVLSALRVGRAPEAQHLLSPDAMKMMLDSPTIAAIMGGASSSMPFTPTFTPSPGFAELIKASELQVAKFQQQQQPQLLPHPSDLLVLPTLPHSVPRPALTVTTTCSSPVHSEMIDDSGREGRKLVVQERWSDELLHMSNKDLKAHLAKHRLTPAEEADLKMERRRAKNRQYAKDARRRHREEKGSGSEPDWEDAPAERIAQEIATLRSQITALSSRADELDALLTMRKGGN